MQLRNVCCYYKCKLLALFVVVVVSALPLLPTEDKNQPPNFFNLNTPSSAQASLPPPNIPLTLPPPPGQIPGLPPPPMGHPLPPPPGGFPPPPLFGHPPFRPPVPFYGVPPPPRVPPPVRQGVPRPPPGPPPIHYPSQDPHRLGAGKGGEEGQRPAAAST